jgi:hypothetical protein
MPLIDKEAHISKEPGGFPDISRWLSEATPPGIRINALLDLNHRAPTASLVRGCAGDSTSQVASHCSEAHQ